MNIIETLFGRQVTPAERLRQHQRALAKAQRELDRELTKLEQQEKKLVMDIKKSAKAGQLNACKVMAKDLVRTRRYAQRFREMETRLRAVGLRIQSLRSNQQMADAMRGATRAMGAMNRGTNMPQIQHILEEFQRESGLMDMKEEMMADSIDDVEDEEDEEDVILEEVLAGLGVDLSHQLQKVPSGPISSPDTELRKAVAIGAPSTDAAAHSGSNGGAEEDKLQARLDALRKG